MNHYRVACYLRGRRFGEKYHWQDLQADGYEDINGDATFWNETEDGREVILQIKKGDWAQIWLITARRASGKPLEPGDVIPMHSEF
jgi:hypothetical protein